MFPVLRTPRLVIRPVRPDDVDPLFERRNDPAVAALQAWLTPVPARAGRVRSSPTSWPMDGPVDGQWFMATVVEAATDEVVGDLVLHPTNELRTAEVGYSLSTRHWGKGYAAEALEAFVAWIIEALPVTRRVRDAAPGQPRLGDGPGADRVRLRGPHPAVVLARRRQLRRLDLRDDPRGLGGLARPAPHATRRRAPGPGDPGRTRPRSSPCARTTASRPSWPRCCSRSPTRCSRRSSTGRRSCRGCGRSRRTA